MQSRGTRISDPADEINISGIHYDPHLSLGDSRQPEVLAVRLAEEIIETKKIFKAGVEISGLNLRDYGLKNRQDPSWKSLYDLFARPWFRRVWVMQEYTLSRDIVMEYGGIWKMSEF